MAKKILTSSIIVAIIFLCTGFCFAAEEDKNTNNNNKSDLGSELTQSMNKIEKTADDLINDEKDNDKETAAGAITDDEMNRDYNVARTSVDTDLATTTTMDGTTWMWIILAVVGVVILATVWVYAMQNTDND